MDLYSSSVSGSSPAVISRSVPSGEAAMAGFTRNVTRDMRSLLRRRIWAAGDQASASHTSRIVVRAAVHFNGRTR